MRKVDNFRTALANLKKIHDYVEPYDVVTETGLVALFEICFEQAWKAMKECLLAQGYDESATGSPRMILKLAFQSGMIDDEEVWLDMMASRNEAVHSYNEGVALQIIDSTRNRFVEAFDRLRIELETKWNLNLTKEN